jgi:hypothetical protein
VDECKPLPTNRSAASSYRATPTVYWRKLNLKAEVESGSSQFSFKRLVPGGFNLDFIGSTCTALPRRAVSAAQRRRPTASGTAVAPRPRGRVGYISLATSSSVRHAFEPSFLEFDGMLYDVVRNTCEVLPGHVIQRMLDSHFLSQTASYDVASNIWQGRFRV